MNPIAETHHSQETIENLYANLKIKPGSAKDAIYGEWIKRPAGSRVFAQHRNITIDGKNVAVVNLRLCTPKGVLLATLSASLMDISNSVKMAGLVSSDVEWNS